MILSQRAGSTLVVYNLEVLFSTLVVYKLRSDDSTLVVYELISYKFNCYLYGSLCIVHSFRFAVIG